jgi:flagellar basal body-associated protein FliL
MPLLTRTSIEPEFPNQIRLADQLMNARQILAIALLTAPALAGCYNAEALHKERQEADTAISLEEVDLGAFRITLPHILGDASDSVVDFHAFGQVALRDKKETEHELESRGPELRSRMLVAIRALNDSHLEEPKLSTLRKNIADVINGALDRKVVKQVGFYRFTFTTM